MPPVGFELTISAGERPQTYALDRAATGTGSHHACATCNSWGIYILKCIVTPGLAAESPDLTPSCYFGCGFVKCIVFGQRPVDITMTLRW